MQDTSFDGASQTSYTGRWHPDLFDSEQLDDCNPSDHWFRFPVCTHSDGMQAFLDVCVTGETEAISLTEAETYRLLCHVLVQHLPEPAYLEAVEALNGMCAFYRGLPGYPALPAPQSVKAKITGSFTAPVYPVSDE
jgi:hypothetical protein